MQTPKGEINDKIMELAEDEELLQKMATAASPEECYDMVKDRIEGVSFEEFTASMSVAMAYAKEFQSGELSEEDLDMIAGGKTTDEKIQGVVAGMGSTVSAGVIVAIALTTTIV